MAVVMTDPDHDLPDEPLDSESLENLKAPADASDTPPMEERIGARRRWSWNPVTDTGASRTSEEPYASPLATCSQTQ